ncbi:hypothetical protein GM668_22105 [Duganella ginsengisoli]|uniref:DUF3465 domain-containing protein n=2 Tax=Pseudoduganella ginsengisoli TaxID=1462440 RepID=A0A6L6Q6P2_9BURK|nr:hypothetical protein [Pseudoduganella ginsengisoli]
MLLVIGGAAPAGATEQEACTAASGTLLVGKVVSGPTFKAAKDVLQGVKLSHTHIRIQQGGGKNLDVAIDNVFAKDYVKNSNAVPASLKAIKVGDTLEVCGQTFAGGIHWVHTNCGEPSSPGKPNGWVKVVNPDGSVGDNIESSETYCYLWK